MVRNLAHTDELTQLYNRRHFVNLAENCIHDWPRYSSTCLLMFDVDHFKQINDSYGHDVGDRVLQLIADTARKEMRHSDVLARFGGEEFIILLSDTQLQDALVIAERIRNSIQQQYLYARPELILKFTVSIGIAELESHTQDLDDLIKKADVALYAAKKSGRNRIEVYRPDMSSPFQSDLQNFYTEKYINL
jgi:diguanylate cyclase (GGDEF)-like protein